MQWNIDMKMVLRFLTNEDGPTAVEYAIMLALIVLVCLAAITTVGQSANAIFDDGNSRMFLSGS